MPYIAGLDNIHDLLRRLPISHDQGVESLVWVTTLAGVLHGARRHSKGSRAVSGKGSIGTGVSAPNDGKNIGQKPPRPLLLKVLGPLAHGAIMITPVAYIVGTAWGRMEQPEWLSNWSLPHPELTVGWFAGLRTLACVVNIGALYLLKKTRKQLKAAVRSYGVNFAGLRVYVEGESIQPTKGPYSIIRHPMSAAILLCQASYAVMWWNYIPVGSLALSTAYFLVSLPYEERVKEGDLTSGTSLEYASYKKQVRYRLIPYVW